MKKSTDLTLELHSADGTSAEFYQSDPQRVATILRFLGTPQVFTQPQLVFASQDTASAIATRTIDVILARTAAPLPKILPLRSPAGPIDITEVEEQSHFLENASRRNSAEMNPRNFRVEVQTSGGWRCMLEVRADVHGTVLDRRHTFAHIFHVPVIPFKLSTGGIGFINPSNLTHATAYPAPDSLPETALPMELLGWTPFVREPTATAC